MCWWTARKWNKDFVYIYWRCIGTKDVSVCSLLFRCTFLYKETANFLDYVWTIVKFYIHLHQILTFTTLYEGCSLRQVVSENCLHRVESSIFRKGVLRKRVWVEKGSRKIYWRRLLDALFETFRNLANLRVKVLNLATVDAPGVICITALGVSCQPELYLFGRKGSYIK